MRFITHVIVLFVFVGLASSLAAQTAPNEGVPSGAARMEFGYYQGEPFDPRRFVPLSVHLRDESRFWIDNFFYRGQPGRLLVDSDAVEYVEVLGTTSKVQGPLTAIRKIRNSLQRLIVWTQGKVARARNSEEALDEYGRIVSREDLALYHVGLKYKLQTPAKFFAEVEVAPGKWELSDDPILVDEIITAGNGVSVPGVKFSPRHSTMGVMALVMRMISFDDFLFEEGFKGRNKVLSRRIRFPNKDMESKLLREAILQGDVFGYHRRYTWLTGPSCHDCVRGPIDEVIGHKGVGKGVGPVQLKSFLGIRKVGENGESLLDPDHPDVYENPIDRKDPKYKEILTNAKTRYGDPRFGWAREYEAPRLSWVKRTFCFNALKLIVSGKYNPLKRAVKAMDRY